MRPDPLCPFCGNAARTVVSSLLTSPRKNELFRECVACRYAVSEAIWSHRDARLREALEYAVTFADVFAAAGTRNEFPNVNAVTVALKCRAALKLLPGKESA